MLVWKLIGLFAAFCAASGTAIDKFMLKRQKNVIHLAMYRWWDTIDNLKIPDLQKLAANKLKIAIQGIVGKNLIAWKTLLGSIVISFILTTITSIIGSLIDEQAVNGLPPFPVYVLNFPFDLLTILITLRILHIIENNNVIIGIIWINLDIIISGILVIFALSFFSWGSNNFQKSFPRVAYKLQTPQVKKMQKTIIKEKLVKDGFSDRAIVICYHGEKLSNLICESPRYLINSIFNNPQPKFNYCFLVIESSRSKIYEVVGRPYVGWTYVLVSMTTFIPTLVFMMLLFILILSKTILVISKVIALHFLELATQSDPKYEPKDFMPATLIGLVFGILAVLIKTIEELIKLLK